MDASIRETFHSAMPGDAGSADARRRMEQRLGAARGAGGGLLPALQALAQARESAPGTSVQALNFHGGALEMKLSAPDAASLDRISQSLRSNGWQADLAGGTNAAAGYDRQHPDARRRHLGSSHEALRSIRCRSSLSPRCPHASGAW